MLHDLSGHFLPSLDQPSGDKVEPGDSDAERVARAADAVGCEPAALDGATDRYGRMRHDWLPFVTAFQRDMLFDTE